MKYDLENLVKTIYANDGEIYIIKNGNRYLLATAKFEINIYKNKLLVEKMRQTKVEYRKIHMSIVITSDMVYKQLFDINEVNRQTDFNLAVDMPKRDGTYERILFDSIGKVIIDNDEEWTFEINDLEIPKKLLSNEY